ncbi:MAG: histidine phosphatase family protein [Gammaproteobacteria bacterium]
MTSALPQIWLVRHGETAWSLTGQHTGRTDIPLTARGEQDAAALKPRLAGRSFAKVLSSPSVRAHRTCDLAGFADVAVVEPNLLEWDYGQYEGRRTAEILAQRPGWRPFEDGSPGGETLAQVAARADSVVAQLRALNADALLFAHRDILRVIVARWVGLPAVEARRFYMDPASISVLGYDHNASESIIRKLNT